MAGKPSPPHTQKEGILPKLQRELCLFLIFLGTFLCLEKYLAIGLPTMALAAVAGVCAIASELMRHGKIQKLAALLLFALFWGFLALEKQQLLADGGKELANRVLFLVNRYYRTEYLYWFVETEGEGKQWLFLSFCSLLGFWGGFFVSLAEKSRSRNLAAISMPLVAVLAGLALGQVPPFVGMLLVLAGFFALQLDFAARGTWILALCMGLSLGAAVLAARSNVMQGLLETYHTPWLQRQLQFEDRMLDLVGSFSGIRLFSRTKAQKEFPLGNGKPKQEGKEILRITMDKRPSQTVYLRGFVGGDYESGSWKSAPKQEFSDWAQKQGLSTQDCMEVVQNFPYQKIKEQRERADQSSARRVSIELKTAVLGYTLVPYYTKIPEGQPMEGDGALSPSVGENFQWDSFLYQAIFLTFGEYGQNDAKKELAEEEKIWESYAGYVQQVYTRLPRQGLERLRALAEEYDNTWFTESQYGMEEEAGQTERNQTEIGKAVEPDSQQVLEGGQLALSERWNKIFHVMELLWSNTDYSQELEPLPEGKDFAEYFLLEQKKGYCVHFATAGTLALRIYGVPARYVTGYVVFPEDFEENGDGTFTASITDERGHAWAEVFDEEMGFEPVELTPPSYLTALQDLQPGENIEDAIWEWEHGEDREEGSRKGQETEQEQENLSQQEQKAQQESQQEQKSQATASQAQQGAKAGDGAGNQEGTALGTIAGSAAAFLGAAGAALSGVPLAGKTAGTGILLAAAYLLFYHRKRRMQEQRQKEFFQKDRAKGALAMGAAMQPMLRKLGLEPKQELGEQEYAEFLEQELPGMGWGRIMSLLQKAAFSEHGITEEEFQEIARAYRELEQRRKDSKRKKE